MRAAAASSGGERELERRLEKLRRERLRAVIAAHSAGIPATEIGAAFGMSKQRALQLIDEAKRSGST